ncbi:MAG: hypothetical protein LBV73_19660 [Paraburkholderia sp.]|jgi:hypothetical protein|nr:hypothetical protein [Paraburkholderia sp.]
MNFLAKRRRDGQNLIDRLQPKIAGLDTTKERIQKALKAFNGPYFALMLLLPTFEKLSDTEHEQFELAVAYLIQLVQAAESVLDDDLKHVPGSGWRQ